MKEKLIFQMKYNINCANILSKKKIYIYIQEILHALRDKYYFINKILIDP